MNDVITLLTQRKSDRSYTDQAISDDILNAIIEAGHKAPTSKHGQHVSVVVVRDTARKAKLAEYSGDQPWVAKAAVFLVIVYDMQKINAACNAIGKTMVLQDCVEGLMVGGVDCGIALAAMQTAANSFGIGTVPIGGIRNNPQEVADLLELPPLTFAMISLCLGYPAKQSVARPRLPVNTFRHDETYNPAPMQEAVGPYDNEMVAFWKAQNRPEGKSWSVSIGSGYSYNERPKIRPTLTRQGMTFQD